MLFLNYYVWKFIVFGKFLAENICICACKNKLRDGCFGRMDIIGDFVDVASSFLKMWGDTYKVYISVLSIVTSLISFIVTVVSKFQKSIVNPRFVETGAGNWYLFGLAIVNLALGFSIWGVSFSFPISFSAFIISRDFNWIAEVLFFLLPVIFIAVSMKAYKDRFYTLLYALSWFYLLGVCTCFICIFDMDGRTAVLTSNVSGVALFVVFFIFYCLYDDVFLSLKRCRRARLYRNIKMVLISFFVPLYSFTMQISESMLLIFVILSIVFLFLILLVSLLENGAIQLSDCSEIEVSINERLSYKTKNRRITVRDEKVKLITTEKEKVTFDIKKIQRISFSYQAKYRNRTKHYWTVDYEDGRVDEKVYDVRWIGKHLLQIRSFPKEEDSEHFGIIDVSIIPGNKVEKCIRKRDVRGKNS